MEGYIYTKDRQKSAGRAYSRLNAYDAPILVRGKFVDTIFDELQVQLNIITKWWDAEVFLNPKKSSKS